LEGGVVGGGWSGGDPEEFSGGIAFDAAEAEAVEVEEDRGGEGDGLGLAFAEAEGANWVR